MRFKEEDRYGLKLIQLALRQPEAFWVARVGGKIVGYLSIFRLVSNQLLLSLIEKAKKGTLELPDFSGKTMELIDSRHLNRIPKTCLLDFYIDALVVKEGYERVGNSITILALIHEAKADLAALQYRIDNIGVIAVNEHIERLIMKEWPGLSPFGSQIRKGDYFRHLLIQRT